MSVEELLTSLSAAAIAVAGVVATYVDSAAKGRATAEVHAVTDADGVNPSVPSPSVSSCGDRRARAASGHHGPPCLDI